MSKFTFIQNYEKYLPTEQEFTDIEKLVGVKLPEDYKAHVLQYNNIDNKEDILDYNIYFDDSYLSDCYGSPMISSYHCWYRLYSNVETAKYCNLKYRVHYYCDKKFPQIPIGTMPIATGTGGDVVIMGIDEKNYGKIFYWLHEHDMSEDLEQGVSPSWDNIGFVANSFTELLEVMFKAEYEK